MQRQKVRRELYFKWLLREGEGGKKNSKNCCMFIGKPKRRIAV